MHVADGILSVPILVTGAALTVAGTAVGLRRIHDDDIPATALMTSVFFIASLIHVPIGPSSAHLLMNGLCGLLLGLRTFPALLVALFLQSVLFGYGGLIALGVNTFSMAAPPALLGHLARRYLRRSNVGARGAAIAGGAVAAGSIFLSSLLIGTALGLSRRSFIGPAVILLAAHLPVLAVESMITAAICVFLHRVRPALFRDHD